MDNDIRGFKEDIRHIKKIVRLSRLPISELRRVNKALEKTYQGDELTESQLIYQIVFLRDAPDDKDNG